MLKIYINFFIYLHHLIFLLSLFSLLLLSLLSPQFYRRNSADLITAPFVDAFPELLYNKQLAQGKLREKPEYGLFRRKLLGELLWLLMESLSPGSAESCRKHSPAAEFIKSRRQTEMNWCSPSALPRSGAAASSASTSAPIPRFPSSI